MVPDGLASRVAEAGVLHNSMPNQRNLSLVSVKDMIIFAGSLKTNQE